MLYSGFNILHRSVFWSAYFNGRSDNTDVIRLHQGSNLMKYRITVFTYCLAGCVIAGLASFLVHLKFGVPFLAYLIFCTVIVCAAYAGGLRDKKTLIMVCIYATIGFAAGGMMCSVTAVGPRNQEAWNARKPLGGKAEFMPCIFLGSAFTLGRCVFIPAQPRNTNEERVTASIDID